MNSPEEVSTVDGQPLHIQLRGVNVYPKGLKQNSLTGIVDLVVLPGRNPPSGAITRTGTQRGLAGREEMDDACPCFRITFTIDKLPPSRSAGSRRALA